MNGRLYDPLIGRMLSPDNYVDDATNTQSYNRYSYVANNPLKYTDPSGWNKDNWDFGQEMPIFEEVSNNGPGGNYNPLNFEGSYYSGANWQISTRSYLPRSQARSNATVGSNVGNPLPTTYNVLDASSHSSWQTSRGGSFSIGNYSSRGSYGGGGAGSSIMNNATAGGGNMAGYAPLGVSNIGLNIRSPRVGIYETISNINTGNDIIGVPTGTVALKLSQHIKK